MTFTETYEKFFDGDKFMHVAITNIDPNTGKKSATEIKTPFDVEKHLAEEIIQGKSNVDMDRKACLWNGWDIDQEMPEEEIGKHFVRSCCTVIFRRATRSNTGPMKIPTIWANWG